jgi:hypothetical protein
MFRRNLDLNTLKLIIKKNWCTSSADHQSTLNRVLIIMFQFEEIVWKNPNSPSIMTIQSEGWTWENNLIKLRTTRACNWPALQVSIITRDLKFTLGRHCTKRYLYQKILTNLTTMTRIWKLKRQKSRELRQNHPKDRP